MEFGSGIRDPEAPVDAGLCFVSLQLHSANLSAERILVRDAPPETTAGEVAELDLRHVQPAAVLGSVVKLQALGDSPGLLWREGLRGCLKR